MTNKEKQVVINTVSSIDYDELAEAIVRAQKRIAEEDSSTASMFSLLTSSLLMFTGGAGILFSFLSIVGIIVVSINRACWSGGLNIVGNIIAIILLVILISIVIYFSILLLKSATEIETSKDKTFIVAVFSGITSFAAVIVALITLITQLN